MNKQLHKILLLLCSTLLISSYLKGQITAINTVYTAGSSTSGNSSAGMGITFSIENTNNYSITLREIEYQTSAGTLNWELWYSATSLIGNPGNITTNVGWIQIATPTPYTAAAAGKHPVVSGLNFTIPANTTYRFALVNSASNISYYNATSAPNIFSANGVNLLVGNYGSNVGYAGQYQSASWAFNPRFFNGNIKFEPAGPPPPTTSCPLPTNVSASPTTVCLGNSITLNATIPSGTTAINWYTTPTGGTPITSTTSNSTTYTPTSTGTVTYYAETIGGGGGNATMNFSYTGSVQTVTLQAGTYLIETWGGDGYTQTAGYNGRGGYTTGTLNVSSPTTYYIYVGGKGNYPTSVTANTWTFNGGGIGYPANNASYGNGGGATDIRTVGGNWDVAASLASRIIVAGGGGAGRNTSYIGGHGGGLTGGTGTYFSPDQTGGPTGGSQTAGGSNTGYTSGLTTADLGKAMTWNGNTLTATFLAGGGGGYYGGASGRVAGGGGSSYIGGVTNGASYMFNQTGYVPSPANNGDGYVRITGQTSCVSSTRVPVTVTVLPKPTVTLNKTGNVGFCTGSSVTLKASGGTTYTWLRNNQVIATGTVDSIVTNTLGAYRVVTQNANGCTDTSAIANVINSVYPTTNLGNDTLICANTTLELDAGNPGNTYLWNTTATTQKINVTQPGTYHVRVTNQDGCSAYDTIVVTHKPIPLVNLPQDTTICSGEHLLLDVTNPNAQYSWSTGSTASSILVNTPNTYKVTVTGSNGCVSMDSTLLRVKPGPSVDLGPDIITCADEGHMEYLDAGNPGLYYTWDNNYNGRVRTVTSSGTYYVRVMDSLGCPAYDTINVTLKPNPISTLGNDTSVCMDQPLTLNAGNNGVSYFWNTGQTANTIIAEDPGEYIVFITGSNGCMISDTIQVAHNGNLPKFDGIQIQNLAPRTFKFNARNPQYVIGYQWDFGDGSPLDFSNSPTHTYNLNGNYTVRLYASSYCGVTFDTMVVHIYSMNTADLSNNNLKVYPNPAQNVINVEYEAPLFVESISILDILGRTVQTHHLGEIVQNYQMNVSTIPSGQYLIRMTTDKGSYTEKITINR